MLLAYCAHTQVLAMYEYQGFGNIRLGSIDVVHSFGAVQYKGLSMLEEVWVHTLHISFSCSIGVLPY